MHIVAKTVKPRTLAVYSKFGFVFKDEDLPKGRKKGMWLSFWGVCLLLPWESISGRLCVEPWLSEICSVSMFDADTVPEEFYLAPNPLPFHFPYDGQGIHEGVFPQTPAWIKGCW